MEKIKKGKKTRKTIGYLAVLAISFGLVVFTGVGATLAWFAGSDWANNTLYMGGPVYVSMYGEDNSGRKITSGFGCLEVSAATGSRTTGITSIAGDTDDKVLLPGQRMEIHAIARLKSSAYETTYRRSVDGSGLQTGTEGELTRSTNALLRARFSLGVTFDADTSVGDTGFYKLPTYTADPAAALATATYDFYVNSATDLLPFAPVYLDAGVWKAATVVGGGTSGAADKPITSDTKTDGVNNYYYTITIGSRNIKTPDAKEWSLPAAANVTVAGGSTATVFAWSYRDGYGQVQVPYADEQDLVNALNSKLQGLIVKSNAVGLGKWGWRYIPAQANATADSKQVIMPDGTTKYNMGYDANGMDTTDVAGWWYLVAAATDIAIADNDFSALNTSANAELYQIDTRNGTDNKYNGEGGAVGEIPFVDGDFVLPGDQLTNMYANAKIEFKVVFQAIQAFLPWQSVSETNFAKEASPVAGTHTPSATVPTEADLGKGKDLTIGNSIIIFTEAFNNAAYKSATKPKNSQGRY